MIHQIRRKVASLGFGGALKFLYERFWAKVTRSRNVLFRIDVADTPCVAFPADLKLVVVERCSFKELTENEKTDLNRHGGHELLSLVRNRLEQRYRLFLGLLHGEVVGALWVCEGRIRNFYVVPMTSNEFMCVGVFVIDKFRGKRFGAALLYEVVARLKSEHFLRAYIFTKEWNPYLKSIRRVGFKPVGRFREVQLGRRTILIWSFLGDEGVAIRTTTDPSNSRVGIHLTDSEGQSGT